MSVTFLVRTRIKAVAEIRGFVFDFSEFPELAGDGLSILSLAAPAVTGITLGTPTPNTGVIEEDGHTIPVGEAAVLPVSDGTAGEDYVVSVQATLSDSVTVLTCRGIVAVR